MTEKTFIPSYAEEALQSLNIIAAYENGYPETSDTQYTEALQNLSLNAHSLGFTDLMQWADEKLEVQKKEAIAMEHVTLEREIDGLRVVTDITAITPLT